MKNKLIMVLVIIGAIIILTGITIGGYYLKRTVNYNMFYKDAVRQEIKSMVKPECLK